MTYRIYVGEFGFYLPKTYDTQEEAEKVGTETKFGFTVENEKKEVVSLKDSKLEWIIRIPETNSKKVQSGS